MIEAWETKEKKWTKTLFHYKQQQGALGNEVEALTKKKKKKENVLIDLELINLKNVSLLNFKELRRRIAKAKIQKLVEANKEHQRNLQQLQAQLEITNEKRKSLDPIGVKKRLQDYEQMLQYYILMRTKNKMKDFCRG